MNVNQYGQGRPAVVEALLAEIIVKAWQDDQFAAQAKADARYAIETVARDMGIDLAELPDLDLFLAQNPVGDMPFDRPAAPMQAGITYLGECLTWVTTCITYFPHLCTPTSESECYQTVYCPTAYPCGYDVKGA